MINPELRFRNAALPKIELFPGPLVLGRSTEADRVVAHEKVSKRHAKIWRDETGWYIEDQGSSNGTQVNGLDARSAQIMRHGAIISFGSLEAVFFDPAKAKKEQDKANSMDPAPAITQASTSRTPQQSSRGSATRPSQSSPSARTGRSEDSAQAEPARQRPPARSRARSSNNASMLMGLFVVLICVGIGAVVFKNLENNKGSSDNSSAKQSGTNASQASNANSAQDGDGNLDEPKKDWKKRYGAEGRIGAKEEAEGEAKSSALQKNLKRLDDIKNTGLGLSSDDLKDSEANRIERIENPKRTNHSRMNTNSSGSHSNGSSNTERTGARRVPQPKLDPFEQAKKTGDADSLWLIYSEDPKSERAKEIQAIFESSPVLLLERDGLLPQSAENILNKEFRKLFPLIGSLDLESDMHSKSWKIHWYKHRLRMRFIHDFSIALGTRHDKVRLAPHPIRIELQYFTPLPSNRTKAKILHPQQRKTEALLFKSKAKTPSISEKKLGESGLTEEEIWQLTLDELLNKFLKKLETYQNSGEQG